MRELHLAMFVMYPHLSPFCVFFIPPLKLKYLIISCVPYGISDVQSEIVILTARCRGSGIVEGLWGLFKGFGGEY